MFIIMNKVAGLEKVQTTIREAKKSREMGVRYMTFQELLKDEREEGRAEGRAEGDRNRLVTIVQKKLAKGDSVEKIADDLVEELSVIQEIVKEL